MFVVCCSLVLFVWYLSVVATGLFCVEPTYGSLLVCSRVNSGATNRPSTFRMGPSCGTLFFRTIAAPPTRISMESSYQCEQFELSWRFTKLLVRLLFGLEVALIFPWVDTTEKSKLSPLRVFNLHTNSYV